MAQLDKLLTHLVNKGGKALRLQANQPPMMENMEGGVVPLLPNMVPATLLEHLATEILSPQAHNELTTRGETSFDYPSGEVLFVVKMNRTQQGTQIRAENKGKAISAVTVSLPPAVDPLRIELMTASSPTASHKSAPKPPPSGAETETLIQEIRPPSGSDTLALVEVVDPPPTWQPQTMDHPTPVQPPPVAKTVTPLQEPMKPTPGKVQSVAPAPEATFVPPPPPPASHYMPPSNEPKGCHPLLEKLFLTLIERKGSDLHLTSNEAPLARLSGDLTTLEGYAPLSPKQLLEMMASIATLPAWQQFQERNDADFAYPFEAGNCRLRVNFFVDRIGPGIVCRVIPNELPDPIKLGLSEPIKRLSELSKGLVLVTGPTGSGKSTTLAAIIDLANQKRRDHILTIEDPIEFVHPRKQCLINQREVGTHTDSFKSGLRAALREDPDIVLVGEMRDLETISIALETAITGHLVFGTLHTNSAVGTIDRIVDQFPADRQQQIRVMLADALKASLSQTLLKKIGGGRVAAIESLFITPAISNLIREGKNFQIPSAMQTGRAYGQRLINDCLVELIQNKTVEPQEAYMKCPDKETFMATLKRAGIHWDPRGEDKPLP